MIDRVLFKQEKRAFTVNKIAMNPSLFLSICRLHKTGNGKMKV